MNPIELLDEGSNAPRAAIGQRRYKSDDTIDNSEAESDNETTDDTIDDSEADSDSETIDENWNAIGPLHIIVCARKTGTGTYEEVLELE